MKFSLVLLVSAFFLYGCGSKSVKPSAPDKNRANELEVVVELSQKAIDALNNKDSESWGKLICGAGSPEYPLIGWNSAVKLIGQVTESIIISKTLKTNASNSGISSTSVTYEVIDGSRKPESIFYKRKLKFYYNSDLYSSTNPCIGLIY